MSFRHKQSTCCNVTCPGAVREKSLVPVPKQAHHAGPRLIRLIDSHSSSSSALLRVIKYFHDRRADEMMSAATLCVIN